MINRNLLVKGYEVGAVRIVDSPFGDGTVCKIGDGWFYFDGETAEQETAESYVLKVPKEDAIEAIFSTLESFREDPDCFLDEYMYYDTFLREALNLT